MLRHKLTSVFMGIYLVLILMGYSQARIINIPDDYPTISEGIAASISGDTVLAAPGEYWEDINPEGKNILITSSDGPDTTSIFGRILFESGEDSACVFRGFYVREESWASTILCRNTSSPIIESNIIANHSGYSGAGVSLVGTGRCVIRNNIIKNNLNLYGGGGMYISGKNSSVTRNIYYGNISYGYGGTGGAIEIHGHCELTYNLFYHNQSLGSEAGAFGDGGAILRAMTPHQEPGITMISNNTFYGNEATEDEDHGRGGAIYNYSSSPYDTLIIKNNIIAFNIASTGIGSGAKLDINDSMYFSWDYNCIYENTLYGIEPGSHDIFIDPLFADTTNHDFSLLEGSPCIDAGDPESPLDPDSTRADIGALFYDQSIDGIDELGSPTGPYAFELHQNYPNPFNGRTMISYSLVSDEIVSLTVYSMTGQRLIKLVDSERRSPGKHTCIWDGCDSEGRQVATGIYLYCLHIGDYRIAKAMILIK